MNSDMAGKAMKVLALSMTLFLCGATPAQRAARWSTDLLSTGVHMDSAGKIYFAKPDLTEGQAQTGVTVPGDVVGLALDYPNGQNTLVFGRDGSGGRVEHWSWNATLVTYVQKSSLSFGTDLGSGCYDQEGDKLYILDASTKLIWVNSWDGLANLPSTGWQVWATKTQVPLLDKSARLYLAPIPAESGAPFKLFLSQWLVRYGHALTGNVNLYKATSTLVIEPVDLQGKTIDVEAWVETGSMTETGSTVRVVGKEGLQFEVLNMSTGVVIGSGTLPTAPVGEPLASLVVAVSTPFAIGEDYLIRKVGTLGSVEYSRTCMRRYGVPETFSDGTRIDRMPYTLNFNIGKTSTIFCPLTKPIAQVGDLGLVGNVAMAVRDSVTGVDPVVPLGATMFLNPAVFLPLRGVIEDSMEETQTTGFAATDIEIPLDPSLVGGVLLFQFWFIDGQNVRLSEVVGIRIENPDDTPLAMSASSTTSASSRKTQKDRLTTWLKDAIRTKKVLRQPSISTIQSVLKQRK